MNNLVTLQTKPIGFIRMSVYAINYDLKSRYDPIYVEFAVNYTMLMPPFFRTWCTNGFNQPVRVG